MSCTDVHTCTVVVCNLVIARDVKTREIYECHFLQSFHWQAELTPESYLFSPAGSEKWLLQNLSCEFTRCGIWRSAVQINKNYSRGRTRDRFRSEGIMYGTIKRQLCLLLICIWKKLTALRGVQSQARAGIMEMGMCFTNITAHTRLILIFAAKS